MTFAQVTALTLRVGRPGFAPIPGVGRPGLRAIPSVGRPGYQAATCPKPP